MSFKYFQGPREEMAKRSKKDVTCLFCGAQGRHFFLQRAICDGLSEAQKEAGHGCESCLKAARFEFKHELVNGWVDRTGLHQFDTDGKPVPVTISDEAIFEFRHTPKFVSCQGEVWFTHCDDVMAYIGIWGPAGFYRNAPDGDGRTLFFQMTEPDLSHLWDESLEPGQTKVEGWFATYYAFRCLHCGLFRGYWDCD